MGSVRTLGKSRWAAFVVGAVLATAISILILLTVKQEPRVSFDDVRPLLIGLDVVRGIPSEDAQNDSQLLLIAHPDGAEAAVARIRQNALDDHWQIHAWGATSPQGRCAAYDTVSNILDGKRPALLKLLTGAMTQNDQVAALLLVTPRC